MINFDQYPANDLFKIKYDPEDYHIKKDQEGNILRASSSRTYMTKVKLYDQSGKQELGILSNDFHQFKGKVFISFYYNYSYKDFLMSYAPKIIYKTLADGTKVGVFEQSESDISNNNYQDYKRVAISQDSIKLPIQREVITPEGQYSIIPLDQNPSSIIGSNPTPNPFNMPITTLSAENNNTGISTGAYVAICGVGTLIGSTIAAAYGLYCYFKKKPNENNKIDEDDETNSFMSSDSLSINNDETDSFMSLDSLSINMVPNDDKIEFKFTANHNAQHQRLLTFKPDTHNTREEDTYKDRSLSQSMAKQSNGNKSTEQDNTYEYDFPHSVLRAVKQDTSTDNNHIYENVSNLIITYDVDELPPPIPPRVNDPIVEVDLSGLPPPPPNYV